MQNLKKIALEFESMDADDVTEASPEIAVPILEQLGYTEDEMLSEILIKLLSSSASKEYGHLVHPSIVNAIKCISPDEAIILKFFATVPVSDKHTLNAIPAITIRHSYKPPEKEIFSLITEYYSKLNKLEGLMNPRQVDFYVANLISLGLLTAFGHPLNFPEDQNRVTEEYKKLVANGRIDFPADPEISDWQFKEITLMSTIKGSKLLKIISKISSSEEGDHDPE